MAKQKNPYPTLGSRPTVGFVRSFFVAMFMTSLLVGSLLYAVHRTEGPFALERALTAFAMPLGVVSVLALAGAVYCSSQGTRFPSLVFLVIFLTIATSSNAKVASMAMQSLEWPRARLSPDMRPFRCIVVLGGGVSVAHDGVAELGQDGQRIVRAAQLWHAGQTESIICTGTSIRDDPDPSTTGRELLESLGVPADVIFEVAGENTAREMKNLADFFRSPDDGFPAAGRVGLITSAFHMKRAMTLAKGRELEFMPISVSFRSDPKLEPLPSRMIPGAKPCETFSLAFKEQLARLVGR